MLAVAPSWVSNSSISTRRLASWSSLASIDGFIVFQKDRRGNGGAETPGHARVAQPERIKTLTAAAEQLGQQVRQARAFVAFGAVQRLLRTVQEFGRESFGERFQHGVDVFAARQ